MTARPVPEWIGRKPESMPPTSVFDRLWDKQDGKDAITGLPFQPGDKIVRDHIVPLANKGKNRETNLQLITEETHKTKTGEEATERAKERRTHERHRGYQRKQSAWPAQRLGNGNNQRSASSGLSDKFPLARRPGP